MKKAIYIEGGTLMNLLVLLFSAIILVDCFTRPFHRQVETEILAILESSPAWEEVTAEDSSQAERVSSRLRKISLYDTASIRAAISSYIQNHKKLKTYSPSIYGRIYLLNRFVFAVPDRKPKDDDLYFASAMWRNSESYLWPFSLDQAGVISLVGQYPGFLGEGYGALEEFDYFNERFGRRKFPSVQKYREK